MGTGYRWLSRFCLGLHASDFNCGFKAYRTDIAKKLYLETIMNDWTFDVEIFCLMKKHGVAFAEIPVTWSHKEKGARPSLLWPVRTGLRSLGSLYGIWLRFERKKAEILLSAWLVLVLAFYIALVVLPKWKGGA